MGKKDEDSPDLYVAAYGDASVADEDWNGLKHVAVHARTCNSSTRQTMNMR